MKANMKEAVRELAMWSSYHRNGSTPDWFTARLYDLIGKADRHNLEALRKGFPHEVAAFLMWQESKDEKAFFKLWADSLG